MLKVGTDCSGIESPIQALINLNVSFSHEFSSEINPYCIQTIQANYNPKIMFTDITKRNVKDVPDIDLYICGFPCQPFSAAGKRLGFSDPRGTIFYSCFQVIKYKRPKYFILENVKGLLNVEGGECFKHILDMLLSLKRYNIYWNILNTKDYGIPQNRERIFIVGTTKEFIWPEKTTCRPLRAFVDKTDIKKDNVPEFVKRSKLLEKIPKNSLFVNLAFHKHDFPNSEFLCPCVTSASNLWCVPFHRKANIKEYLLLQGFPPTFKQVVSDAQMRKQIGNSMSVCVMEAIFKKLL